MSEYTDGFTLDGRLRPTQGVTKAKVAKVKELWEKGRHGDKIADAMLSESITSTDAIFNAAYLTNIQVLQQFDTLPRTWSQVAGVRVLPDFRPAVLTGLFGNFLGLDRSGVTGPANPAGIAPVVAELEPYPYATVGSVEAAYGQIKKRGFKVGWSWEAQINDSAAQFFDAIPGEMLQAALDSEEWEVYQALINGGSGAGSQLAAGTTYQGNAVTANAPISRDSVILALQQLSLRQVNGRYIGKSTNGYNLIVPIGASAGVNFLLNQQIYAKLPGTSGGYALSVQDNNDLNSITVVESQYVTGTAWYLLPKPGGLRRPVLELGRLRGHESPFLAIDAQPGNYIGGGAVSPFEGNFYNDAIDVKIRHAITGVLWFAGAVMFSRGDSSAVS
jgi:hypothetical protein